MGNDHTHADIIRHLAINLEKKVTERSVHYIGTGSDGSAPTGILDKVDPSTCTPNVDGLEVTTRGNVSWRTGKHPPEHGPISRMVTISDMSLGTKTSKSNAENEIAMVAIADTGELLETGTTDPSDIHLHALIKALTGNLYSAIPAEDTNGTDS